MTKAKKKRNYGSASANAEKRSSGASYGYLKLPKDVRVFNPEIETTALLDIIPYEVTDKHHMDKLDVGTIWYKKPFKVHRNVGPTKDTEVCLTTFGQACPHCDYVEDLKNAGETSDDDLKAMRAKYRDLYAVRVLKYDGKKKFDKKAIHLFDFSDFLFQEVFETQLKKKDDFDDFFIPESGKSLEVTFDKKSFGDGKPFPVATRIDFVKRKKQYKESILDEVPNLDEVLNVLSYEEYEAKLHGEEDEPKKEKKNKKEKKEKKGKKEKEAEPKKEKKEKKGGKKSEKATSSGSTDEKKKGKDKKKDKKPKVKEGECPFNHKYGKDCDKFDECADCENWPACKAAKKANKKKKK